MLPVNVYNRCGLHSYRSHLVHGRSACPASILNSPAAAFGARRASLRRLKVVVSVFEDLQPSDESSDAPADPRARRMQRQQRRAARRGSSESQSDAEEASDVDEGPAAAGEVDTSKRAAAGSRIAARRQQRSRGLRRVPQPLVADNDAEDEDEDEVTDAAAHEDEEIDADDDEFNAEADEAASSGDGEAESSSDESLQTLPTSILEAATQSQQRSSRRGSSTSASSNSSSGGGGGGQQRQQQSDPVELPEVNPMFLPVLTDEDLEADPPGHKSGYVAVIGRPNAGKSTLINAIVGQKLSIVTFKPQTTRHRVVGIASGPEYQMILFDTPGIMQEQRNKLDERMMAAVVSSIKAAEVIVAVVDSGDSPQEALAMFQPGPDWTGPPMAVLLNKADLLEDEQLQQLEAWYKNNCRAEQVFVGSALSSEDGGVADIKAWAIGKLPEGPTLYPKSMVSEQPERFFVSEIIREQIFLQYKQEIPYCCQVQIAEFKERPNAKDYVRALILVERESQSPILLGKGGAAIKKLSSAARSEIEEFLGRPVYLELSVQVAPAWRQQLDKLKDFGYFDPLYIT